MAHIWVKDKQQEWSVIPLVDAAWDLATLPPQLLRSASAESDVRSSAVLLRTCVGQSESWVLVAEASSHVRVNGSAIGTGLRVLNDRDEIGLAGECLYLSTESLASIESFAGNDQQIYCPRCKQQIKTGDKAVKCPGCKVWHHQSDDLPCWTYSDGCALCGRTTDLAAGFQWTPEDL